MRADPVFTFTSARDFSRGAGVGFPNPYYICDAARLSKRGGRLAQVPWSQKKSKVYFRGELAVAPWVQNASDVEKEPRVRLGDIAASAPEDFDVGFTALDETRPPAGGMEVLRLAWRRMRHVD